MIDLSASWNATTPRYALVPSLPNGPINAETPSAISSDGQSWFIVSGGTGYTLNFGTQKWSPMFSDGNIGNAYNRLVGSWGLSAVTDPITGLIYVPGGYIESSNINSMLQVNLATSSFERVPMDPTYSINPFYSAAWSRTGNMLLLLDTDGNLQSYIPSKGWNTEVQKGQIPSRRSSACLLSFNDGAKMVYFGGYSREFSNTLSDIHILDVATMTWTSGPSIIEANRRSGAACAVSNGQFIAWGGVQITATNDSFAPMNPVIFNLKTNTWVSRYVAPPPSKTTTTQRTTATSSLQPSSTAGNSTSPNDNKATNEGKTEGGSRIPIILGAVIGVLVVVVVVGGLFWYRARRRRSADDGNSLAQKAGSDDGSDNVTTNSKGDYNKRSDSPDGYSMSRLQNQAYPPPPPSFNSLRSTNDFQDRPHHNSSFSVSDDGKSPYYPPPPSSRARSPNTLIEKHPPSASRVVGRPQLGAYGAQNLSKNPHTSPTNFQHSDGLPKEMYFAVPPSTPSNPHTTSSYYHIPTSSYQ
ncbi:hypothetical protein BX616_002504 [Lobosporangium transversale]|nr:hypothetical protein BX616_002504 [Lobosporangium transversale]